MNTPSRHSLYKTSRKSDGMKIQTVSFFMTYQFDIYCTISNAYQKVIF
jgi:hypothetical protein